VTDAPQKDFHQIAWDAAVEDDCRQLVRLAVREDLDRGCDWTTVSLVDPEVTGKADVVARQEGVVAGLPAAKTVLEEMAPGVGWVPAVEDGTRIGCGEKLAEIRGPARDLLTCERILLNFLGRLSGIATLTAQFVERVAGTKVRIYDTRKTTPGWRRLEKYAVGCGGGQNHRTGLFDAVLIKDNHLAIGGSDRAALLTPAEAVKKARAFLAAMPPSDRLADLLIEVEVDTLDQLMEVLPSAPDIVLLDNMTPDQLRAAAERRNAVAPRVQLEASGNVHLDTVKDIAATGIDRISSGALTHSARWLDVGLDWQPDSPA